MGRYLKKALQIFSNMPFWNVERFHRFREEEKDEKTLISQEEI
jgi:hypothetical protein